MDKFGSYELNSSHHIRQFYADSLPKLLKGVRGFLKNQPVHPLSLNVNYRFDDEYNEDEWAAELVYIGTVEEN